MTFTIDQLKAIGARCKAPLLELYTPRINEAMAEFEITTPMRAAAFIAQLFHESGGLIYMEEIASGAAYDNRKDLGNTRPEAIAAAKARGTSPGRLFKGRGPIQLTGFDNYKIYGAKLGLDLIAAPELAASPEVGFRIAGLYWHRNALNVLADKGMFKTITRRINGGLNGYEDRVKYYGRAKRVLGIK
jgi:predicted chitinase